MRILNEEEIRKAIYILHPPDDKEGCLFECRIIADKWNLSGYFTDADKLINALQHTESRQGENVYITLNFINDACYARTQQNKFMKNATPTTSDTDVIAYQFLMIDLDPERTKGVSSSDEEFEAAHEVAKTIFKYMKATGWNDPVIAESGNGVHLLYKLCASVTADRIQTIKDCLQALDVMFSTDRIKVDTTTFNPARICKLYGTIAQKGADTKIRPHRMSRILFAPQIMQSNAFALCEALAKNVPKLDTPAPANHYNPRTFDLREWIGRHGIQVKAVEAWDGGTKFVLDHCVFDSSHKAKDAAIFQRADGKICYHCFHASCADKQWRDVRLMFEPDAYSKDAPRASFIPNYERSNPEAEQIEPVWLTPQQVRHRDKPKEEYIATGIREVDECLIGLKKGFVTLISGLRACGKSSLISQIALNAADKGHITAIFSGELTAENAMKWMYLQAAGKSHVKPSRYNNRWYVPDGVQEQIASWLDSKLYIYNNDCGFRYDDIKSEIEKCADEKKLDLLIIDNMMCLDLSALDRDIFVRQSVFVNDLESIAKRKNIHIILIAHPRKSNGFLRLQDVSGSNDIVNRADNAIIMHRVNHDFIEGAKTEFKWKSDDPIFSASNVLEICKDRDGGTTDKFIPLFYEPESKRLKNEVAESVVFGWCKPEQDEEEVLPF